VSMEYLLNDLLTRFIKSLLTLLCGPQGHPSQDRKDRAAPSQCGIGVYVCASVRVFASCMCMCMCVRPFVCPCLYPCVHACVAYACAWVCVYVCVRVCGICDFCVLAFERLTPPPVLHPTPTPPHSPPTPLSLHLPGGQSAVRAEAKILKSQCPSKFILSKVPADF
jgi:hypothetical protein